MTYGQRPAGMTESDWLIECLNVKASHCRRWLAFTYFPYR